jgi:hypothetical protein
LIEITDYSASIRVVLKRHIIEVPVQPTVRLIKGFSSGILPELPPLGKKIRFVNVQVSHSI